MTEQSDETDVLDGLREVAERIAAQASCASGEGECYRDHDGCSVAESLRIAREVLARHEPALCQRRYIVESLADPVQDERMKCARTDGHGGRHINKACDLTWDEGAEISVAALLTSPPGQTIGGSDA